MMTEYISTMNGYLICESSLHLDREDLRIKLHVKEKSPHLDELEHLVAEAERIGRPKAYYRST